MPNWTTALVENAPVFAFQAVLIFLAISFAARYAVKMGMRQMDQQIHELQTDFDLKAIQIRADFEKALNAPRSEYQLNNGSKIRSLPSGGFQLIDRYGHPGTAIQ